MRRLPAVRSKIKLSGSFSIWRTHTPDPRPPLDSQGLQRQVSEYRSHIYSPATECSSDEACFGFGQANVCIGAVSRHQRAQEPVKTHEGFLASCASHLGQSRSAAAGALATKFRRFDRAELYATSLDDIAIRES